MRKCLRMRDRGGEEQTRQPSRNFQNGGQVFQESPVFNRLEEEISPRDVPGSDVTDLARVNRSGP
jgi:hypothetical protein